MPAEGHRKGTHARLRRTALVLECHIADNLSVAEAVAHNLVLVPVVDRPEEAQALVPEPGLPESPH